MVSLEQRPGRPWSWSLIGLVMSFGVGLGLPLSDLGVKGWGYSEHTPRSLALAGPALQPAIAGLEKRVNQDSLLTDRQKQWLIWRQQTALFRRYPMVSQVAIAGSPKVVALTFDDGPWPGITNEILYVLKRQNVKATFFVVGQNVQAYPQTLKLIAHQGHALGNHSWNHPYRTLSPNAAAQQIDRTNHLVKKITGQEMMMFRPPGGFLNNGMAAYAKTKGLSVVMWSADSQDYRASRDRLLHNLLTQTGSGGILLMHDGGGDRRPTLAALPELIRTLRSQGYQFVTVPELMARGKKPF